MPDNFRDIRLCLKQVMNILQGLGPDIDAAISFEDDPYNQRLLAQARVGIAQATRIVSERISLLDADDTRRGQGKEWVEL